LTVITVTPNTSVDRTLEVPGLTLGGHLQGRLVRLQPGGKGVNVARCLAALGVPSVVTGLVGAAELALFRESFAPMPVAVELVPVAAPTRTCTTLLDPERGTDTHIREQGACVTPDEIGALHAKLAALASPDALVVFCGSLPPGMSGAHLEALLAACRERGAPVAADLNGSALSRALAAHPLLIKPNVEELGECLGRRLAEASDAELLEATRSLLDRVGTVLLTRGRRGALAVSAVRALACAVAIPMPGTPWDAAMPFLPATWREWCGAPRWARPSALRWPAAPRRRPATRRAASQRARWRSLPRRRRCARFSECMCRCASRLE